MSKDRQSRKRREEEKARRVKERKLSMLQSLCCLFGLRDRFMRLPRSFVDDFILQIGPMPQVAIDERLAADAEARELASEMSDLIEQDFDLTEVGFPVEISLGTFLRVWFNLNEWLAVMAEVARQRIAEKRGERGKLLEKQAIIEEFRSALSATSEAFTKGGEFLFSKLTTPAQRRSSPCERIYWFDLDVERTPSGRIRASLRVMGHFPEAIRVPTPSGERRAFELVKPTGTSCEAVRWDRAVIGLEGPGRVPVLVLKHAVERLEERLPLRDSVHFLHTLMVQSLEQPRIARRSGNTLLVEFRNGPKKYGYLVAELISGAVLVRTFKFLTMQGTPESDELRRVLGLHRRDIEYLRLDDFFGLTCSDFQEDPLLSRAFAECGCGHLISLLKPELRRRMLHSTSFDVRKYLGIGEATGDQASRTPPGVPH